VAAGVTVAALMAAALTAGASMAAGLTPAPLMATALTATVQKAAGLLHWAESGDARALLQVVAAA